MNKYRSMTVWQRSHSLVMTALGTPLQFRRHLRIAVGSAAETECLIRIADEAEYLPKAAVQEMAGLLDEILALLFSLVRRTTRTAAQTRT